MIEWRRVGRFAAVLGTPLLLLASFGTRTCAGAWDWATGPSIRDKEGKRDWGIDIAPYAWVASINGNAGLPLTCSWMEAGWSWEFVW